MPAKKKSFTATNYADPAAEMLSEAAAMPERTTDTTTSTKTKRVNLILRPHTIEQAQKIAYMQRISINELVSRMLDEFVAANAEALTMYEKLFDKEE